MPRRRSVWYSPQRRILSGRQYEMRSGDQNPKRYGFSLLNRRVCWKQPKRASAKFKFSHLFSRARSQDSFPNVDRWTENHEQYRSSYQCAGIGRRMHQSNRRKTTLRPDWILRKWLLKRVPRKKLYEIWGNQVWSIVESVPSNFVVFLFYINSYKLGVVF